MRNTITLQVQASSPRANPGSPYVTTFQCTFYFLFTLQVGRQQQPFQPRLIRIPSLCMYTMCGNIYEVNVRGVLVLACQTNSDMTSRIPQISTPLPLRVASGLLVKKS